MAARRRVTSEDLYELTWVSGLSVHPATGEVVYGVKKVNNEHTGYLTHFRKLDKEGNDRVYTSGETDGAPVWSPDGTKLAFIRKYKDHPQIWILPHEGGEAAVVTEAPYGVEGFIWSPDSRSLLFKQPVGGPEEVKAEDKANRVVVSKRTKPKSDGSGEWDGRYRHLHRIGLEDGAVQQLTEGNFDVGSMACAPDGSKLVFTATIPTNPHTDPDLELTNDLFELAAEGGSPRRLTSSQYDIHLAVYSPDGREIVFLGDDLSYSNATLVQLYRMPAAGGEVTCVTAGLDLMISAAAVSDMRGSTFYKPVFSPDGKQVYTLVTIKGSVHLYSFALDGSRAPEALTQGERDLFGFALDPSTGSFVIAAADPLQPGDLFRLDPVTGEEKRLTELNKELLAGLELSEPESFWFEASDGEQVQGWIMKPAGFTEGGKYPAVLEIHGGPHAMYAHTFMHEFQLLASQGYAVVYSNPRGSHGYGQLFVDACRGDYGGRDYQDLMELTDYATDHYSFIDADRWVVTGGSYGGFMTNWIVGHTNRFKAAVTQRSISNWISFYGVSDIGYFFTEMEIGGGNPWEHTEMLWKHSPLAYVQQVDTPLLILHGEEDLRCPIEQGEQLFTALKRLGKTAELVRFPGASHDLSRTGRPILRVERLNRIAGWFNQYLESQV
ncbi:S9 family peptidase [Paenibacillus physcomitrellae]|uniref:Peptidase YuxL n=1 Tax=Paenibacillus physcomitrellae TaxID=1619311 RepID=A0ABQ1FY63_9BACL|nr:S9 family peptidase [Paenibacillus physcomitrellae]GGA32810.1 putative peptidase YuxL [Paenibacillus physcomitrellae]